MDPKIPVVISLVYPAILAAMVILGYWIADKYYRKKNKTWAGSGIENAIIGLYALLLSFTLLSSGNMQGDRNSLVHHASDAAAQISRSSVFFTDRFGAKIKDHLSGYLGVQIRFYEGKIKSRGDALREMGRLNERFMKELSVLAAESPSAREEVKTFMPMYNELNAAFYRLVYSFDERTPAIIMFLLVAGSFLIAILVGFMNGLKENRHYLVPIIFFVLVGLSVQAIRDLNNPYGGLVRPDYQNIREIQNYLLRK